MVHCATGRLQVIEFWVPGNFDKWDWAWRVFFLLFFCFFQLGIFNCLSKCTAQKSSRSSAWKLAKLKWVVSLSVCSSGRALTGWPMKTFSSTLTFSKQMMLAHINSKLCRWAWFFLNKLRATSLVSGTLNFDWKLNTQEWEGYLTASNPLKCQLPQED